jgi:hypothetical protein
MKPGLQALIWIAVGVVIANLAWVLLLRSPSPPRAARKRTPDVWTGFDAPGPGVKILQFYASRGEVIEGEHAIVCYGAANAKTVRIEPAVEEIQPAHNRCISITPEKTTTYTLHAGGNDGSVETAGFTVKVLPAPPNIKMAAVSDKEISRGESVTVCAAIDHATSARIEPINMNVPATGGPACVKWYPAATLSYRLVAKGIGGEDRIPFKVAVRVPAKRK